MPRISGGALTTYTFFLAVMGRDGLRIPAAQREPEWVLVSRPRVLALVLAGCLVLNVVLIFGLRTPWPDTALQPIYWFLTARQGGDSWRGMLRAHTIITTEDGRRALYERAFFGPDLQHDGFQYPPTALLIVGGLDTLTGGAAESALRVITWIAIPITALVVLRIAGAPRVRLPGLVTAFAATLAFYPVMRAYRNGQIQTWLTALFAGSLLAFASGRPATSGAFAGLACLVKPQWGLVLVWAALRREARFALGFVAAIGAGLLVAVPLYGVRPFIDYVGVLRFLSRHGEAYFPNQSVNGLLHRLLFNGDNLTWSTQWIAHFPPFHPAVYAGTLISSALVVGIALFGVRARADGDRALDYALVALAGTMASPIAWEHHYGVLLPIFALLLHRWDAGRLAAGHAVVISGAFVLAATHVHATTRVAATRWNVVQSLLFFTALVVFAVLVRARQAPAIDRR